MKHTVIILLLLILGFFHIPPAVSSASPPENTGFGMVEITCDNSETNARLRSGEYRKKIDNFLILQDRSRSMAMQLLDVPTADVKIEFAKGLLNCLNNTFPDNFNVTAGLRSFPSKTADEGLVYGMLEYNKAGFADAVRSIKETSGNTSIGKAINFSYRDIENLSGQTALIIFSDGMNTEIDDPFEAATTIKNMTGNTLCIYTIQISVDLKGRKVMDQIAEAGRCGFAVNGSAIDEAGEMDQFVTDVFLARVTQKNVKTDRDSDNDSVPDSRDECPNTPEGIIVDGNGCPIPLEEKISITLHIEFDFNKAEIKSQYYYDIAKIANILKAYPEKNLELEGHTDSIGTDDYNLKLSERRAESIKKYLVEKFGIEVSRISTVGYGESMPIDTNDTVEGRQNNRRVVANIETVINI